MKSRNENCQNGTSSVKKVEAMKQEVHIEGATSAFEGRFKATRMWNGVMKRFRNGMPLKRHRRLMFSYEDSFTGKEAVDFLMNELPKFYSEEKEITRSNCHMLLQKFIDAGLFLSVRGNGNDGKDTLRESELYRFSDIPMERMAATPILVRRAASFNERCSFGSGSRNQDPWRMQRFQKTDNVCRVEERLAPAADVLPSVRSPLAKSRRLSSSHGNLPSMVSPRMFDTVNTETLSHVQLLKDLKEGDTSTKNDVIENEENLNFLDEVITELQKVGDSSADINTTLSIRSFGKVLQSAGNKEASPGLPEHRNKKISGSRSRLSPVRLKKNSCSGVDVHLIWKEALMNRLQKTLRVNSLDGIIDYIFTGSDVKWNCEKIGIKGIVKVKNENDDLSTYLIAMMRYLTRWPFDRKFVEKVAVYPGMERNVFENVCEHFAKGRPILPNPHATAILNIVSLIKARNPCVQNLSSPHKTVRMETEFSNQDTPVTRYVSMLRRGLETYSNVNEISHTKFVTGNLENARQTALYHTGSAGTLCGVPSKPKCEKEENAKNLNCNASLKLPLMENKSKQEYNELVKRMPNLQHTPELLLQLNELSTNTSATRSNFSTRLMTPRLGLSPLVASIAQEDEKDLIESVALVLLTLRPTIRRRLHYLLRFMEKICKNHCLRLNLNRENRYVVLERLSESVLSPSRSINSVQCLHLVTFLVDSQDELFLVPTSVKMEAENLISTHQKERKTGNSDKEAAESLEFDEPTKQYCKPIKPNEYDQQKEFGVETHLLSLLDSIMKNETLEERKKQLRKFKKTYPEIYSKRFPSPKLRKPRTPSFLERLRSLNFRQ